jgi:hypothetical protein
MWHLQLMFTTGNTVCICIKGIPQPSTLYISMLFVNWSPKYMTILPSGAQGFVIALFTHQGLLEAHFLVLDLCSTSPRWEALNKLPDLSDEIVLEVK